MNSKLSERTQEKIRQLVLENGAVGVYQMVLNGTLARFPKGFWSMPENHDYARDCVKYLIEHVLQWSREDICKYYSTEVLRKYKLMGMYLHVSNSIFNSLDNAYPNEFKPWELAYTPMNYWTFDNAVQAVRWLFTEKYPYDREFILNNYNVEFMVQHGLTSCTNNYRMYDMIVNAFPNEFSDTELRLPTDLDDEMEAKIIRELITELGLSKEEVYAQFSSPFLKTHRLESLSRRHESLFEILDNAYPNEFDYATWKSYHQNRK